MRTETLPIQDIGIHEVIESLGVLLKQVTDIRELSKKFNYTEGTTTQNNRGEQTMKKIKEQYNKLSEIMETIDNIISYLEKEKVDIEQNIDEDRDMNYIEQEMYDELDEQSNSLYCCLECIENAMDWLEKYTD